MHCHTRHVPHDSDPTTPPSQAPGQDELRRVLGVAQSLGFLGQHVAMEDHVRNAEGFAEIVRREPAATLVDLGSGGGVPALVLALELDDVDLVLVERGAKRAAFLRDAVVTLGIEARTRVIEADAEALAHDPAFAECADVVTARSFAPPATTAEAACRFLREGGRLIVSEPPIDPSEPSRWPAEALTPTGLVPTDLVRTTGHTFQVLHRRGPIDPRLPRRAATSRKRPLFP